MTEEHGSRRTIVVGVDASPGAEAALRWAIDHAREAGAEVIAVHAYETPLAFADPYTAAMPPTLEPEYRDGVRKSFEEEWCAPLAAAGIPYRTVMADGDPARVLIDVAEQEAAELVVTGRRRLTTLGELVLGSVSHHLVHRAKLPVVLVPSQHQTAA